MDFSKFRETGELSDIVVQVGDKDFLLHKFPLYIKSGFFKSLAKGDEGNRIELNDFPGGPDVFEVVANYCYNMRTHITKDNVCALRCAAEYLQMTSGGNLASASDRFLQDTLTTAKLSRSLSTILDLMVQCSSLGPIAAQANIVEKCISAIVDCWLISSKFGRRLKTVDVVGDDTSTFKKLCQFPLDWFMQLFVTARDRNVRPAVLAAMVEMYISGAMERETETPTEVTDSKPDADVEAADKSDEGKDDVTDADGSVDEGEKDEPSKDRKDVEETKKEKVNEEVEGGPREDLSAILDALLAELPDNAPLADTISPQWAAKMLQTADSLGCKSRERLLKLTGRVLHRFTEEEFQLTSPDLLCEVAKETRDETQNGGHADLISEVVDNYTLYQASAEQLNVDTFQKLVEVTPAEHRLKHDTLFLALEKLLESDKVEVSEEEKQALLEMIDFTRLSEETLQRAYESKLVPVNYVTKASLQLCAKLRAELDDARATIQSQEVELEKYGLGGRGSTWNKSNISSEPTEPAGKTYKSYSSKATTKPTASNLEFRQALDSVDPAGKTYKPYSTKGTTKPASSDLEFRLALDSVDRSLDRSIALSPVAQPSQPDMKAGLYGSSYSPHKADAYVDDLDYNHDGKSKSSYDRYGDLYSNPHSTSLCPRSYVARTGRY